MTEKTSKRLVAVLSILLAAVLLLQCFFWSGKGDGGGETLPLTAPGELSREGYTLSRVVILSRHSIRSPLSGSGSLLGDITSHEWFLWTSAPAELSLKGGVLETEMGQYFRRWLEAEGLFPANFVPQEGQVRIYANSMQRTVATARFFSAGLLPMADTAVEHHYEIGTMDPVFNPVLTFLSDRYAEAAENEVFSIFGDDLSNLSDNYDILEKVIDYTESPAYASGEFTGFVEGDTVLNLSLGKEPGTRGSLKTACSVSDALVLQYYETDDITEASFGEVLTQEEWDAIAEIKDIYVDMLYTSPLIAENVAHPLLAEIFSEMNSDGRLLSFLCGHDSNVASVLSALGAAEYSLPESLEKKTPIGCKVVFSRWENGDGEYFWSVDLVYQTPWQLRDVMVLDVGDHPGVYHIILEGIMMNGEGLYAEQDFFQRFREAIDAYDEIVEEYTDEALDPAA